MLSAEAVHADEAATDALTTVKTRFDLQKHYLGDLHRYVSSFIVHSGEAEDVTMEALNAAFEQFDRLRNKDNPKLWLLGIARRKVVNHFRRSRREFPLEEADGMLRSGPSETRAYVHEILRRLPVLQREALILKYAIGLSQAEVGALLKKSPAATNSLLQRARARFIELDAETLANGENS